MMLSAAELLKWAPVIAQVVLVVVTICYAWTTSCMVGEMTAAREAQATPRLVLSIVRAGGGPMPILRNIGPGAAMDVKVRLRFEPETVEAPWSLDIPLVLSGACTVLNTLERTMGNIDKYKGRALVAVGTYGGVLAGRSYEFEERVKVEDAYYVDAITDNAKL
jgi:hypothetical protein